MKAELLAQNLRIFRAAKGYTQEDVSNQLNIQRQTYCNYENGRRIPNLEILMEISRVLEVTLDMLVADSENPKHIADKKVLARLVIDYQNLPKESQKEVLDFISFQKSKQSKSSLI